MKPEEFYQELQRLGIRLSDQQKRQFATYYLLLIKFNRRVNLTSIVQKTSVYLKHFYDSITPARYLESLRHQPLTVCDVGSGAGFPSLPLKIVFPQLKITIVDSLNKRIRFLRVLVHQLGLQGVSLIHARAEIFGGLKSKHRERYDLVLARAVARMNVLSELCLPLVRIGGRFVALKSVHATDDLKQGRYAIQLLGGRVIKAAAFRLPISQDPRTIIIIRKQKKTPAKYPRRAGVPTRRPLVDKA